MGRRFLGDLIEERGPLQEPDRAVYLDSTKRIYFDLWKDDADLALSEITIHKMHSSFFDISSGGVELSMIIFEGSAVGTVSDEINIPSTSQPIPVRGGLMGWITGNQQVQTTAQVSKKSITRCVTDSQKFLVDNMRVGYHFKDLFVRIKAHGKIYAPRLLDGDVDANKLPSWAFKDVIITERFAASIGSALADTDKSRGYVLWKEAFKKLQEIHKNKLIKKHCNMNSIAVCDADQLRWINASDIINVQAIYSQPPYFNILLLADIHSLLFENDFFLKHVGLDKADLIDDYFIGEFKKGVVEIPSVVRYAMLFSKPLVSPAINLLYQALSSGASDPNLAELMTEIKRLVGDRHKKLSIGNMDLDGFTETIEIIKIESIYTLVEKHDSLEKLMALFKPRNEKELAVLGHPVYIQKQNREKMGPLFLKTGADGVITEQYRNAGGVVHNVELNTEFQMVTADGEFFFQDNLPVYVSFLTVESSVRLLKQRKNSQGGITSTVIDTCKISEFPSFSATLTYRQNVVKTPGNVRKVPVVINPEPTPPPPEFSKPNQFLHLPPIVADTSYPIILNDKSQLFLFDEKYNTYRSVQYRFNSRNSSYELIYEIPERHERCVIQGPMECYLKHQGTKTPARSKDNASFVIDGGFLVLFDTGSGNEFSKYDLSTSPPRLAYSTTPVNYKAADSGHNEANDPALHSATESNETSRKLVKGIVPKLYPVIIRNGVNLFFWDGGFNRPVYYMADPRHNGGVCLAYKLDATGENGTVYYLDSPQTCLFRAPGTSIPQPGNDQRFFRMDGSFLSIFSAHGGIELERYDLRISPPAPVPIVNIHVQGPQPAAAGGYIVPTTPLQPQHQAQPQPNVVFVGPGRVPDTQKIYYAGPAQYAPPANYTSPVQYATPAPVLYAPPASYETPAQYAAPAPVQYAPPASYAPAYYAANPSQYPVYP